MLRSSSRIGALALVFAGAVSGGAGAQTEQKLTAPTVTTPTAPAIQPEKKPIYDEAADAREQIGAAIARAKKENKRVIIQWGANWCGWCRILDKTFEENGEVRRKLNYEYELVRVDVGRFDKHIEIAEAYEADFKSHGIPYLTVLGADGKPIANQETGSLETKVDGKPGHDAAKVLAFLEEHQATPLNAEQVLSEAMQQAEQEDQRVFLHFGAPWCGWCHRFEAWLAREEVAETLAQDFALVKIDTDRMTGGKDLLTRYAGEKPTGIPFSVVLEPDGTVVTTVVNDKGENIGCPWTDEEIAAFGAVLARACRNIDAETRDSLLDSLRTQRESKKEGAH
jgi:thiol:disulfide interchange protein